MRISSNMNGTIWDPSATDIRPGCARRTLPTWTGPTPTPRWRGNWGYRRVASSRFVSSVAYRTRHSNRRKLPVASEQLYQPSDLLRFVDLGGGALVPGSSAVVYAANTLDGETASKDTALWLADSGEQRRLAPADAAQSRPSVSPDGSRVAFLQVQAG